MSRRGLIPSIRKAFSTKRDDWADNKFRQYVQPWGARGLHVVQNQCNSERKIVSGPARTFAPGAVVPTGSNAGRPGEFILMEPPPGRRGGAAFGTLFPSPGDFDVLAITSADPSTIAAGSTNTVVTLTGTGFKSTDSVRAVVWDESTAAYIADTLVTADTFTYISSTSATVQIDVSSSAPVGYPINLEIRR